MVHVFLSLFAIVLYVHLVMKLRTTILKIRNLSRLLTCKRMKILIIQIEIVVFKKSMYEDCQQSSWTPNPKCLFLLFSTFH